MKNVFKSLLVMTLLSGAAFAASSNPSSSTSTTSQKSLMEKLQASKFDLMILSDNALKKIAVTDMPLMVLQLKLLFMPESILLKLITSEQIQVLLSLIPIMLEHKRAGLVLALDTKKVVFLKKLIMESI
jgi:hypothetical protein